MSTGLQLPSGRLNTSEGGEGGHHHNVNNCSKQGATSCNTLRQVSPQWFVLPSAPYNTSDALMEAGATFASSINGISPPSFENKRMSEFNVFEVDEHGSIGDLWK